MATHPINTSAIMLRQRSTLLANSQNIVKPATTSGGLTFLDKISSFISKVTPVVNKVTDVVSQLRTRVPGTNLLYNPQLAQQQQIAAEQKLQQSNMGGNINPVLLIGGAALLGFIIYKTIK